MYVLRKKQCRTNYARRLAKTLDKCFEKQSGLDDIRVMTAACDALAHFINEERTKLINKSKFLSKLRFLLTSKCPAFPVVVDGVEDDPDYVHDSSADEGDSDGNAARDGDQDEGQSVQRYPTGKRPVKTIHHQPWVSSFVREIIQYLAVHDRRTGEDTEHTHRIDKDVETNADGYIKLDQSHINMEDDDGQGEIGEWSDKPLQKWMVKDEPE